MIIETIITAIWLMLPAYITNSSAAFFGGKTPIDRGIYWGKNRLLGDGKTYGGFFKGFSCGFLIGIIQQLLSGSFGTFPHSLVTLVCLSAGAMLGDLLGSLIKRKIGLKRGVPLPLVDQLDFVAGAWLLLLVFARHWFFEAFTLNVIIAALIITPLLHLSANYIAFKMGKKNVPW
jgi:CDP-2,3-bis-(O-geranylgeranyl)-sn-glycerol synthase